MIQLLHHLAGDHSTLEVMRAEVQAHLLGQEASAARTAALPQPGGAGPAGDEPGGA